LTCVFLVSSAFQVPHSIRRSTVPCNVLAAQNDSEPKNDNKAMAFLRKIGKVGGSLNQVTNLVGVDEGPAGKASTGGMKVSSVQVLRRKILQLYSRRLGWFEQPSLTVYCARFRLFERLRVPTRSALSRE
jgi:hypothetical protein